VTVEQTDDQNGNQQDDGDHRRGTLSFHGVLYTRASPTGRSAERSTAARSRSS
jgi:hypothetical protein